MINFKLITQAIEDLLNDNTAGYTIERNAERNSDPNRAAKGNGLINISKGTVDYESHTIGSQPWLVTIHPQVEIQFAHNEGWRCEDGLEDAVAEILGILTANKTLNGTVLMTNGYKVEYDINEGVKPYHQAAMITITAEARA
jgi:hypothetical protein